MHAGRWRPGRPVVGHGPSRAHCGRRCEWWPQELLDFCGEHGIVAEVETMPSARVNDAFDRLAANDVRYRFVLDMSDLRAPPM